MSQTPISRHLAQALVLAGGLSLASVGAQAQPAGGVGQGGGGQQAGPAASMSQKDKQELKQAQKKIQKLRQEINDLQDKALENNPDLKQKREDLKALVKEKMRAEGATPDEDIDRMKELRGKLQDNPDMKKGERQELMKEFRGTAQGFKQAQQKAMQDSEVQKKREQFQNDLQEAMKQEDPQAEQKLNELKEAQKAFREKLSSSMGGAAGGQGMGGNR